MPHDKKQQFLLISAHFYPFLPISIQYKTSKKYHKNKQVKNITKLLGLHWHKICWM